MAMDHLTPKVGMIEGARGRKPRGWGPGAQADAAPAGMVAQERVSRTWPFLQGGLTAGAYPLIPPPSLTHHDGCGGLGVVWRGKGRAGANGRD
jgi:hypothetical protein